MTKIKILFMATLLSLLSCSKDDDDQTGENPQAENCKISTITYGAGILSEEERVYTTTYSGENLTELTSSADKVVFTYDSQNHLTKKESYLIGNSQVQLKSEFTTNSNGQVIEQRDWNYNGNSLQYRGKTPSHTTETKSLK